MCVTSPPSVLFPPKSQTSKAEAALELDFDTDLDFDLDLNLRPSR